jgi:hypothetical protein
LQADITAIRAKLTATEDALKNSLAREANLWAQLEAAQATHAHVSVHVDGLGNGTPVRNQLSRHPSPLPQTPTTPSRPSSYRTAVTTPRGYRAALFHVDGPSPSQNSPAQPLFHADGPSASQNSSPLAVSHVESLANYYNFLRVHDLTGFIPSLDTLRKSIPISSWSEQMKLMDIPVDKIDALMSLMANAC